MTVGLPGSSYLTFHELNQNRDGLRFFRYAGGSNEAFGSSMTPIGDLDGNGVVDLAVGADNYDYRDFLHISSDWGRGAVFILFLEETPDLLRPRVNVASTQVIANGRGGLQAELVGNSHWGRAVAPLGDVDGDGVPDLAVGSARHLFVALSVLFLNADGTVKSEVHIPWDDPGLGGFVPGLTSAMAAVGDLDGNGVVDLVVDSSPSLWTLFLEPDGSLARAQEISKEDPLLGIPPVSGFGHAITALGDLDGDGVTDVAVGAFLQPDTGAVWILFLRRNGTVKSHLVISSGSSGFPLGDLESGERFGCGLAALEDFDGNGVRDLAVGAPFWNGLRGRVWLLNLAGFSTIDFETDDRFDARLLNGLQVKNPDPFGRLVTITGTGGNHGPAIFASSMLGPNAGGTDPDLLVNAGNLLVLQEDPLQTVPGVFDHPSDSWVGGTLTFEFPSPVELHSIDLVDIDPGPPVQDALVNLFDGAAGTRTFHVPGGWTGDVAKHGPPGFGTLDLRDLLPQPGLFAEATAWQDAGFEPGDVRRMTVQLSGSGAVSQLVFDATP